MSFSCKRLIFGKRVLPGGKLSRPEKKKLDIPIEPRGKL